MEENVGKFLVLENKGGEIIFQGGSPEGPLGYPETKVDQDLPKKTTFFKDEVGNEFSVIDQTLEKLDQILVTSLLPQSSDTISKEDPNDIALSLPEPPEELGRFQNELDNLDSIKTRILNGEDPRPFLGKPPGSFTERFKYYLSWKIRRKTIVNSAEEEISDKRAQTSNQIEEAKKVHADRVKGGVAEFVEKILEQNIEENESDRHPSRDKKRDEKRNRLKFPYDTEHVINSYSPTQLHRMLIDKIDHNTELYETGLASIDEIAKKLSERISKIDKLRKAIPSQYLTDEISQRITKAVEDYTNQSQEAYLEARQKTILSGLVASAMRLPLLESTLSADISNMIIVDGDGKVSWAEADLTHESGLYFLPTNKTVEKLEAFLTRLKDLHDKVKEIIPPKDQETRGGIYSLINASEFWLPIVAEQRQRLIDAPRNPKKEVVIYSSFKEAVSSTNKELYEAIEQNRFSQDATTLKVAQRVSRALDSLYSSSEWSAADLMQPSVESFSYTNDQNVIVVSTHIPEIDLTAKILIDPHFSEAYFYNDAAFSVRDVIFVNQTGQAVRLRDLAPGRTEFIFNANTNANRRLGLKLEGKTETRDSVSSTGVFYQVSNGNPYEVANSIKWTKKTNVQVGNMNFVIFGDLGSLTRFVAFTHELGHEWEDLIYKRDVFVSPLEMGLKFPEIRKQIEADSSKLASRLLSMLEEKKFITQGTRKKADDFLEKALQESYGTTMLD